MFGAAHSQLCLKFSPGGLGYVLRHFGGELEIGSLASNKYDPSVDRWTDESAWGGTEFEVAPYTQIQFWAVDDTYWVQFGSGPRALTLVFGAESFGRFLHGFGDWLIVRGVSFHLSGKVKSDG